MGFALLIWDAQRNEEHLDDVWKGDKYAYAGNFFEVVCRLWTDVLHYDAWADGRPSEYRPANASEADAVRAELRAWGSDENRDLFLHVVDCVAQNVNLRLIASC